MKVWKICGWREDPREIEVKDLGRAVLWRVPESDTLHAHDRYLVLGVHVFRTRREALAAQVDQGTKEIARLEYRLLMTKANILEREGWTQKRNPKILLSEGLVRNLEAPGSWFPPEGHPCRPYKVQAVGYNLEHAWDLGKGEEVANITRKCRPG